MLDLICTCAFPTFRGIDGGRRLPDGGRILNGGRRTVLTFRKPASLIIW